MAVLLLSQLQGKTDKVNPHMLDTNRKQITIILLRCLVAALKSCIFLFLNSWHKILIKCNVKYLKQYIQTLVFTEPLIFHVTINISMEQYVMCLWGIHEGP